MYYYLKGKWIMQATFNRILILSNEIEWKQHISDALDRGTGKETDQILADIFTFNFQFDLI